MRYRWKLLILLLTISLIPIVVLRVLGVRNVRLLANNLVSETREHLTSDAEDGLRFLVDSYSALIRSEGEKVEALLMFQAREVERFLAQEITQPSRVYFAEDFNEGLNVPGDTTLSPVHFRSRPDGSIEALRISYSNQVFKLAPGVKREDVDADINRVSAVTPIYQEISRRLTGLSFWHYTSLKNGLHGAYPGHNGIPRRLDPRIRSWYTAAFEQNAPWSDPYVDPETRQVVIAATIQVRRASGDIAGVTAIVVPISNILEKRLLVKNIPPETGSFMIYLEANPEDGQRKARIFAHEEYTDVVHRHWRAHVSKEWLTSEDKEQFRAMIADFEIEKNNIRRMPYKEKDSLWAYGATHSGAFLVLITPYDEITRPAKEAEEKLQGLIGNLIALARYSLLGAIILVVVLAFTFSRTVTKPIEALVEGARRLAKGDFEVRTEIRSRDELGDMGQVFNTLGPQLKEHYRMSQSLALAREVEQSLLPRTDPKVEGLDIVGKSIYCDETGGDYYDYLYSGEREEDKIGIVVGDVSGHGIESALLMTTVRAFLRQRSSMPGSIAEIVSDVNQELTRDVEESGRFMTLFYSQIDTREKIIRWVRAGHDPGIIYNPSADSFDELGGEGLPLGIFKDSGYIELKQEIMPGHIIFIGTDGIWETRNPQGVIFGKENLREIIRTHAKEPATEIIGAVIDAVESFRSSLAQEDDITLVVIKVEH
ncbi:MAG: SpoIIE family protein phosphatase [Deltaproteobacteria bacterium]|nr:MAG: SpoIIE family protein phosphatase [Deltaproteobacteria bacterium]